MSNIITYHTDDVVLLIGGGTSWQPDGQLHILVNHKGTPYCKFCDGQQVSLDDIRNRQLSAMVPVSVVCPSCLFKYGKWRKRGNLGPIATVGKAQRADGLYLVAGGENWSMESIVDSRLTHHSAKIEYARLFVSQLSQLSQPYGYRVEWERFNSLLYADKPDYRFNWIALRDMAMEKAYAEVSVRSNRWNGKTSN